MKDNLLKSLFLPLFFLGFCFRLWQIGSLPSLNRDEAAIGYNAYSILKTGKDEWGQPFPLSFKSFGDYKMPAYIYATVLPIKLFGLNVFSVRFWSLMSGIILVGVIYWLALWIFEKIKIFRLKSKLLAQVSALILLFNPWHLYFSRVGFEANPALLFFTAGLTAFLYGLKKRFFLPIASILFAANLYTYSSGFVYLPFIFFTLSLIFFKELFRKKDLCLWLAIGILFIGGFFAVKSVWQVSEAKANITVFNDPGIIDEYNHKRTKIFQESPLAAKLWYNKPLYYSRIVFANYLKSFSPKFLIISAGSHPWHQIPGSGNFYWTDLFFMILGLFGLFFTRKTPGARKTVCLLLGWLFIAPLPSAITVDAPHATRMLQILPILVIFITLGMKDVFAFIIKQKKIVKIMFYASLFVLYLFQVGRFGYLYFINYPKLQPEPLLSGIEQAIEWAENQKDNRLVIFSDPLNFPYIYTAFYAPIEPGFFQKKAKWKPPDLANLTAVEEIGKYRFWEGPPELKEKAYYIFQENLSPPANYILKYQVADKKKVLWRIYEN